MAENLWLTLLLVLPFAGALILCGFCGQGRGRAMYLTADLLAAAEFALALFFAVPVLCGGGYTCRIKELCGFGLSFELDGFRAVWLIILSFMWLTAVVFSKEYMEHHRHVLRYYCFTFLTLGATAGVFLSADLLTTFLFFELMSFTSYVWVAQEETKGALRAAETYLAVAVLGGLVMLMGLFLLYHLTGTLALDGLREACAAVQERGMLLAAGILMLFGFGAKAGMFPLHIWLPKAHPVAPAPASALLSGVLTKAGIFGVILLSGNIMHQEKEFGWLVLFLGAATMLHGAVLGVFSVDLKRTLACSSVSQIGFILVGLGMGNLTGGNALAVNGAFLHAVNHSLIKLVLFLLAGVVYCRLHSLDLTQICGFGRKKPFFLAVFLCGAFAVAGMPLFSGYISKTLLHEAIVEGGELFAGSAGVLLSVTEWVFLVSGGLTAAYMLKLFTVLFLDEPSERVKKCTRNYLSMPVRLLLAVPAGFLLLAGLLPDRILLPAAEQASAFFGAAGAVHGAGAPHWFSMENLSGAGISIGIGIFVYFTVVRQWLRKRDGQETVYVNRLPAWYDLEESVYRPLFLRLLPFLLAGACRLAESVVEKTAWFLSGPLLAAVCRLADKLVAGIVWLISGTMLSEKKPREHLHGAGRIAYCAGRVMDDLVLLLNRTVRRKRPIQKSFVHIFAVGGRRTRRTAGLVARSVSYGLMLAGIGLVITMLYLLLG